MGEDHVREATTHHRQSPVRKPTRFLTDAGGIADELDRRCDRGHRHQALLAGRARDAAM